MASPDERPAERGLELPSCDENQLRDRLKSQVLDTPTVLAALEQAKQSHATQKRDHGGGSLEEHVFPVARTVVDMPIHGENRELAVAAALLHDVLEDDDQMTDDLFVERFGPQLYAVVKPLSKSPAENNHRGPQAEKMEINRRNLEGIARGPLEARLVKLADRLNNLSSIWLIRDTKPDKFTRYLEETRRYHLPFAEETSPYFARLIREKLAEVESLAG